MIKNNFDKLLHLFICIFLMSMFRYLFEMPTAWALTLTSFIAVSKEIYDKYVKKSKFDWYDILADAVGIGIGLSV